MNYIQLAINADAEAREILIATLSEWGFEGFEENEETLYAFIPEEAYNEIEVAALLKDNNLSYSVEIIPQKNWNETWESNFSPVIVDDFCTIRAGFHNIKPETPYEIVITPKMSFGTGHHATTQLMIKQMREIDMQGKAVFDFGTGTGILSILASMLGAGTVLAIDNDEWSYENAQENIATNNIANVNIKLGAITDHSSELFDIILANINRHILLEAMPIMTKMLKSTGLLVMSGLLLDDYNVISQAAEAEKLELVRRDEYNGWIALAYRR